MTEEKTESLLPLPKGWVWTRLGEVAVKLQSGGTPSTKIKEYYHDGTIPFVKIKDLVEAKKYLYDTETRITQKGLNNSSAWLVPEGSLLYSMYASYGIPAINKVKVATSQAIITFVPPNSLVYVDYVYYYLWSIKSSLKLFIRGTTQENLNATIVSNLPIPLAPLQEQKRIVSKIEELFSRIDAGVEALKKAREQLKRYRQSVLKSAFEGNLTKQWRENNKDKIEPASMLLERIKEERRKSEKKFKELPELDTSELPRLPEGWVWTRMGEFAEINPSLPYNELSDDLEVSFLPMKAVEEETGKYDLSLSKKYGEVKKGYTPFINGDVIFAKITPCMENGKIAVLDNLKNGIGFGSTEFHVIRCLKNYIYNKFVFFYLLQEIVRKDAKTKMKGTAGQLRVPVSYIRSLIIPLPPLQEQKKIVEEIERRFSIADQTEHAIEQSLTYARRLRQSILKQAFEGKLVPQDPTDEPASILLEKIKAEKARYEGKKNEYKDKPKIQKRQNKQYMMDSRQTRLM